MQHLSPFASVVGLTTDEFIFLIIISWLGAILGCTDNVNIDKYLILNTTTFFSVVYGMFKTTSFALLTGISSHILIQHITENIRLSIAISGFICFCGIDIIRAIKGSVVSAASEKDFLMYISKLLIRGKRQK